MDELVAGVLGKMLKASKEKLVELGFCESKFMNPFFTFSQKDSFSPFFEMILMQVGKKDVCIWIRGFDGEDFVLSSKDGVTMNILQRSRKEDGFYLKVVRKNRKNGDSVFYYEGTGEYSKEILTMLKNFFEEILQKE